VFIFWRPKRIVVNLAFVIVPLGILLYGAFLTHSRGFVVALMAMAVVAVRRRIGTLPALLAGGGLFAAAQVLNFAGGRDISASAGSDRTSLWGEGLQMVKSHPLFGVGYNRFTDYSDHTAHNSIVVCAAEIGLVGLYFWSLFLYPTLRDVLVISSPAKVSEAEPVVEEQTGFPAATITIEAIDKAEINRLARLVLLSLTGFLVAGWFLSRAFVMTLFLLGGMAEVVYEMALRRGMVAPRQSLARVLPLSGLLAAALLLVMYLMIRVLNFAH
jgi:hypothetical protein